MLCCRYVPVWINVTGRGITLKIKESLKDSSLDSFTGSNSWLENWKAMYCIRETRITGEADGVSIPTVKSWIERMPKLVRGYKLEDIWNMDELGLFFKILPDKGLIEKAKSKKGGKKAKVPLTKDVLLNRIEHEYTCCDTNLVINGHF